jgi:hypothetical protein
MEYNGYYTLLRGGRGEGLFFYFFPFLTPHRKKLKMTDFTPGKS